MRLKLLTSLLALSILATSVPVEASYTPKKATVNVNETYDFDSILDTRSPQWITANKNIVTVDKQGVVTGKAKGSSKVFARAGNSYDTFTLKVVEPTIKLNKSELTLWKGGSSKATTARLSAKVSGARKDVTWTSSNYNIVSVTDKGLAYADNPGKATITAKANGITTTCEVTVKSPTIDLSKSLVELTTKGVGRKTKLTATVKGPSKSVSWYSTDPSVCTVSKGTITAKSEGTAVVIATANGVSSACEVNVNSMRVGIDRDELSLFVGDTKKLKVTGIPNRFYSKDSSIAIFDAEGNVTGLKEGTTDVCVIKDGITDSCTVTVKAVKTDIKEDSVNLDPYTDKTKVLEFEVVGKKSKKTWKTSDKSIVTVSNGKLTAKKPGSAVVTLTANDITDSVSVNVLNPDIEIELSSDEFFLTKGQLNSATLKATVKGTKEKPTWISSDTSIVKVNSKGKITAVSAGQAEVVAVLESTGESAACLVNVNEAELKLDNEVLYLLPGEAKDIGIERIGNISNISYKSSDKKIAKVVNGTVVGIKPGEAVITLSVAGKKYNCVAIVNDCAHTFVQTDVLVAPTCGEEGRAYSQCSICGAGKEEIMPKLEQHSFVYPEFYAECGSTVKVMPRCSVCDLIAVEYKTVEHEFSDWVELETTKERYCYNCDKVESEPLPEHEPEHECVFSSWFPTPTHHERFCQGCAAREMEDHEFGEWSIGSVWEIRSCLICGYDELEYHVHDYSDWVDDGEVHSRYCSTCFDSETEEHVFSQWYYTSDYSTKYSTCDVCGHYVEEPHEHVFPEEYQYDANNHWRVCTECGYTFSANHLLDGWKYSPEQDVCPCTVCDYADKREHVHTYSGFIDDKDSVNHTKTCSTCADTITGAHTYGEWTFNTETGSQSCTECRHTLTHNHVWEWEKEQSGCKGVCTVCSYEHPSSHTYTYTGTVGECKGVCTRCGFVSIGTHSFSSNTCTKCNFTIESSGGGEIEPTVPPLCNHDGIQWQTKYPDYHVGYCATCNITGKGDHNFLDYEKVDDNVHRKVCTRCKYAETSEHDWTVVSTSGDTEQLKCRYCEATSERRVPTAEPTCDKTESWTCWGAYNGKHLVYCSSCKDVHIGSHTYANHELFNAYLCKATCSVCGDVAYLQHDLTDTSPSKTCNNCKTTWTDYSSLAPPNYPTNCQHDNAYWEISADTHNRLCAECNTSYSTFHDYKDINIHGWKISICSDCGYVKSIIKTSAWYTDVVSHSIEYTHTVNNTPDNYTHLCTCNECGYAYCEPHDLVEQSSIKEKTTYVCSLCGLTVVRNNIVYPETHKITEVLSKFKSVHIGLCSTCDKVVTENHTFGPYTYFNDDACSRTCTVCGYTVYQRHDRHSYDAYDSAYCKACNNFWKEKPAEFTNTPNCKHPGACWIAYVNSGVRKHRVLCNYCNNYDKDEHSYENVNLTLGGKDYSLQKCNVCDYVLYLNRSKFEHPMLKKNVWYAGKAGHVGICKDCGESVYEAHHYGEWTPMANTTALCERTCTVCGVKAIARHVFYTEGNQRICENCNYSESVTNIEPLPEPVIDCEHSAAFWYADEDSHCFECDECECGRSDKEAHDYAYVWLNNKTYLVKKCMTCDYVSSIEPKRKNLAVLDIYRGYHITKDSTGQFIPEAHLYGVYAKEDNLYCTRTCLICGYKAYYRHVPIIPDTDSGSSYECSICKAKYTPDEYPEMENCADCAYWEISASRHDGTCVDHVSNGPINHEVLNGSHSYENATVGNYSVQRCSVCGYVSYYTEQSPQGETKN